MSLSQQISRLNQYVFSSHNKYVDFSSKRPAERNQGVHRIFLPIHSSFHHILTIFVKLINISTSTFHYSPSFYPSHPLSQHAAQCTILPLHPTIFISTSTFHYSPTIHFYHISPKAVTRISNTKSCNLFSPSGR
jgi:hypothetical protein